MNRLRAVVGTVLAIVLASVVARAQTPAPLEKAVARLVADEDHWAFTQRVRSLDGQKVKEDRLERYDPSKPDDQQWTLIEIGGKAPTEGQRKSWAKRKAKQEKRGREESLGSVLAFERAVVVAETERAIRYEVPLKVREENKRFPADKFIVHAQVTKTGEGFEEVALTLRDSFRVKGALGLAKVNAAEAKVTFKVVDEKHAPTVASIRASGAGRIAFVKVGAQAEVDRSDFKRVKPYRDRFGVKIGEVKALDF